MTYDIITEQKAHLLEEARIVENIPDSITSLPEWPVSAPAIVRIIVMGVVSLAFS